MPLLLLPKFRSISWYKMSIETPKEQLRSLSWSAEGQNRSSTEDKLQSKQLQNI